ncbi:hypothetical protein GA0061105_11347 [Rhizobium aethiopicum]|uniref:Uncharacterized protein n=1 Tax=Rhizobium aethiopicum TaxID=1138170 RepID=A0A1C3Y8L0_9HYPH|nr:hypothetical protein GA0061105_11347 [Rhizobium aethiopicum]
MQDDSLEFGLGCRITSRQVRSQRRSWREADKAGAPPAASKSWMAGLRFDRQQAQLSSIPPHCGSCCGCPPHPPSCSGLTRASTLARSVAAMDNRLKAWNDGIIGSLRRNYAPCCHRVDSTDLLLLVLAVVDKLGGTMNIRTIGAVAISFAVAGCTHVPETPFERLFRRGANDCHFPITLESTRKVMETLEIDYPTRAQFWEAISEVCKAAKAGNKSKAIQIRVRDSHGVLRKIVVERE